MIEGGFLHIGEIMLEIRFQICTVKLSHLTTCVKPNY